MQPARITLGLLAGSSDAPWSVWMSIHNSLWVEHTREFKIRWWSECKLSGSSLARAETIQGVMQRGSSRVMAGVRLRSTGIRMEAAHQPKRQARRLAVVHVGFQLVTSGQREVRKNDGLWRALGGGKQRKITTGKLRLRSVGRVGPNLLVFGHALEWLMA